MSWSPNTTVTINGIDYTGQTLENVRIVRGRQDVFEEPRAGYVNARLVDLTGAGFQIRPLDRISITMQDSTAANVVVFTGTISDTFIELYDDGAYDGTARGVMQILATGPLARLNRRFVGFGGRAAEDDGDRVAWLLEQALGGIWDETGGTWNTVATATTTWDTFDIGLDLTKVDQPGVYEIAALAVNDNGYSALSEAYLTALSARGVVWDTADGYVAYGDADRRRTNANAGYLEVDRQYIDSLVLTTNSSQTNVVNRATVVYDSGAVTVDLPESIYQYGVFADRVDTNLANAVDAGLWAADYLEDRSRPSTSLEQLSLRLDTIADNTFRDNLLDLDVNAAVVVENLPATLNIQRLPAFVEGLTWDIDENAVRLTLNVSDAQLSLGAVQWDQVLNTLDWNTVSATLTWQNASEVTA